MSDSPPDGLHPLGFDRRTIRSRIGMFLGTTEHRAATLSALTQLLRALLSNNQPTRVNVHLTTSGWELDATNIISLTSSIDSCREVFSAAASDGEGFVSLSGESLTAAFSLDTRLSTHPSPLELARVTGAIRPIAASNPTTLFSIHKGGRQTQLHYETPTALALELGAARSHRLHEPWHVHVDDGEGRQLRAALWWAQDGGYQLYSTVNGYLTSHGGTHVDAFWNGWVEALRRRCSETGHRPPAPRTEGANIQWTATLVLLVSWPSPHWGPATRCCLVDEECGTFVERHVVEPLLVYLRQHDAAAPLPPWQQLGGLHRDEPWLSRLAKDLAPERSGS